MGEAKNSFICLIKQPFHCYSSVIRTSRYHHISSPFTLKMGDRSCYNCGESGHISRECTKPRQGGGGGGGFGGGRSMTCYNCNEEGHISRDCPQGRSGGRGGGGGGNCYNCGEPGHLSRDCTQ